MDTTPIKKAIHWRKMIDVLLSEHEFADTVIQNGYVINVITREIYQADVAIKGESILKVGDAKQLIGSTTELIDATNKFVSPGFIDSHMHFESAMLTLTEFSRLSIPTGTTTLVADPHEIGNVLGVEGMKELIMEARTLPNQIYFTVPCVTPDAPGYETAGYQITSSDMQDLLNDDLVIGIGEIQGFSNVRPVYKHASHLLDDQLTSVAYADSIGKSVEGNAPGLFDEELAAHIISGGTHISCHETTTKAEAVEKLRYGVNVFVREGSSQHNMQECIRAITEEGLDSRRMILVSDDLVADDLIELGHMNEIIKRTIAEGVDPVEVIQMVTINAATHFGFKDIGILAPGKRANIVILEDLETMQAERVLIDGKQVAQNSSLKIDLEPYVYPTTVKESIKREKVLVDELTITSSGQKAKVRALEVIPYQNLTGAKEFTVNVDHDVVQPCLQQDVLPICVVERHGKSKRVGKSFLHGFGIQEGAIAESVSHDTHNIIVTGTNYQDMAAAVNRVIELGGGISLAKKGIILGDMALAIGGLMTDEMEAKEVSAQIAKLQNIVRKDLGSSIDVPFMHLSFLSLITSPKWKITDYGLIDVERFEVLPTVIS